MGMTRKTKGRRESGRLYASSAGECERRNVLHVSEELESTWDAAAELYTSIGTSVHKSIQDALFKRGALLFSEFHLPPIGNLNLGGYVDAIALVEGKVSVVEIKTIGKLPHAPRDAHRIQAIIYSIVTGLPAYVLYQSREVAGFDKQLKMRSFRVDVNEEEMVQIMARLVLSTKLINEQVVPPIPARFKSERDCGYCPFRNLCWSGAETTWPEVSADRLAELASEARGEAVEIVADRLYRRNGILKFIGKHGTIHAKEILAGSWESLV